MVTAWHQKAAQGYYSGQYHLYKLSKYHQNTEHINKKNILTLTAGPLNHSFRQWTPNARTAQTRRRIRTMQSTSNTNQNTSQ